MKHNFYDTRQKAWLIWLYYLNPGTVFLIYYLACFKPEVYKYLKKPTGITKCDP